MSKSEESALKAYPVIPMVGYYDLRDEKPTDGNKIHRRIYVEGYEKAEKDLALTPEDITVILNLVDHVKQENGTMEDVCRLFNESRL